MVNPSPRQIKAARALVGWTMPDLAEASGVARSTIANYERGADTPNEAKNVAEMAEAMGRVGIEFLPDGVRLDASRRVAAAVRAMSQKVMP